MFPVSKTHKEDVDCDAANVREDDGREVLGGFCIMPRIFFKVLESFGHNLSFNKIEIVGRKKQKQLTNGFFTCLRLNSVDGSLLGLQLTIFLIID